MIGITGAAISQWTKPLFKKGVLVWVDETDNVFADVDSLEKAKRSGKAYIKVGHYNRLPTPFELTNDDRWGTEGELYKQFDLELGDEIADNLDLSKVDEESYDMNESCSFFDVVKLPGENAEKSSVKVLSENTASQNKNSDTEDENQLNLDSDALFNEFQQIHSPENAKRRPEKGNGQNHQNLPPGILTI